MYISFRPFLPCVESDDKLMKYFWLIVNVKMLIGKDWTCIKFVPFTDVLNSFRANKLYLNCQHCSFVSKYSSQFPIKNNKIKVFYSFWIILVAKIPLHFFNECKVLSFPLSVKCNAWLKVLSERDYSRQCIASQKCIDLTDQVIKRCLNNRQWVQE